MTTKRHILWLLLLLPCCRVAAQGVAFASHEHPMAVFASQPRSLSLVDSHLYAYSSGVLLKTLRMDSDVVGFLPDTDFVKLDEDANYVVRHPVSGDLYFTRLDRKGRSCLYFSHRDGKRTKTKRVKLDDIGVVHPTFSADGQVMVFSSDERKHGYGGFDLWYSLLRDGEWSRPVNMGNRVNSPGDDVTPCIVDDYLFFSSNGRDENRKHLNVYATRLIATQVTGDTVGMLQIGRSRVQQLPQGINSAVSDCHDFVVDTLRSCAYWVNSASGLRSYSGPLSAMTLWGHIYNSRNKALAGVKVVAYDGEQAVAMASSGADGFYRITLPVGSGYRIRFSLPLSFSHEYQMLSTTHYPLPTHNLIGEEQHDVVLDSLPVGRPFQLVDLFGPDAVVDLSPHGIEVLQPLVDFLADNPTLQADLTLSCDLTDNAEFNALLAEQRLQRLQEHLHSVLPPGPTLRFHSGASRDEASGDTRLTVILR
ncbi:MAG: carboxypeptidase regulatory-like domain-containing protein [Bacteroidales bacterium]|nr:carboxypeptidase regulatory-like domain-containing protein [Bacteroidales bacterium]